MVLLKGPTGWRFLSQVPLYECASSTETHVLACFRIYSHAFTQTRNEPAHMSERCYSVTRALSPPVSLALSLSHSLSYSLALSLSLARRPLC